MFPGKVFYYKLFWFQI